MRKTSGNILQKTGKVLLAPLAGVADLAYRLIARELGAEFCFYEMADSHSLVLSAPKKNADIHQDHPQDRPIAAQLLGPEAEIMYQAAKKLLALHPHSTFLDINAACPVKKVLKKKSGAYLIKEPDELFKIIDKLASKLKLPITVKLRAGYTKIDTKHIVKVAQGCVDSGAQALFVHGRTMSQLYHGEVDYESIKAIKDNVKVPVYGSGNIFSPQDAKKMIDLTGCDGVLVARGSFGNPWLFRNISNYLENGELTAEPTLEQKLPVLRRHIQYIEKYKLLSPKAKVGFSRKIAVWYLKHFRNSAAIRTRVNKIVSFDELYCLIDELLQQQNR
ncbi:MAG: tRNA dihydrouridine synthase DusB [bacterium]